MNRKIVTGLLAGIALLSFGFAGCSSEPNTAIDDAQNTGADTENPAVIEYEPGAWKADGIINGNEYRVIAELGSIEMRYAEDGDYAYFAVQADTEGWVSVGITSESGMKDADLIFGMVKDGLVILSDQFSTGRTGPHAPDEEFGGTDDVLEFGGREIDGVTTIEFKRLIFTGDTWDVDLSLDTIHFIVAAGARDDFTKSHVMRGSFDIGDKTP